MKIVISDKAKKDIFTALFQTLKNCTNIICVIFYEEYLYIQGMDKSHICLFNVKILNSWFNEYQKNNNDTLETIAYYLYGIYEMISGRINSFFKNKDILFVILRILLCS